MDVDSGVGRRGPAVMCMSNHRDFKSFLWAGVSGEKCLVGPDRSALVGVSLSMLMQLQEDVGW